MKDQTIFRHEHNKEHPYVAINAALFANDNLSLKAKGLLGYLLTRPDDWKIIMADLVKRSTDGRASVRASVKELIAAGHLVRRTIRKNGKIASWILEVHEIAVIPGKLESDFQQVENQQVENRPLPIIESIPIIDSTKRTPGEKISPATPVSKTGEPYPVILFKRVTGKKSIDPALYEMVCDTLTSQPDETRLREAWAAWLAKGYKRTNISGVLAWYTNGIPQFGGNGRAPGREPAERSLPNIMN